MSEPETLPVPLRSAPIRHDGWTDTRRAKFLDVLGATANVRAAAQAARKAKATAYTLRKRDPDFARAWEEAIAGAMDELEAVAYERARDGVEKIVVRAGGDKVTIREYSERLLMFMLSRRKPEVYAQLSAARTDVGRERDVCAEIEARVAAFETRPGKEDGE